MIETRDLSCTFSEGSFSQNRFTAVSPISAVFKNGGRYAIVGESGSGKTTLARMIAGLQKPDGGNVYFDNMPLYGRRYKARKEHFKRVQIIQQNSASALDPKMSVGKSIEEPLICFFGMDKARRKKRCEELLTLCNLPVSYYARLPSELSGGEQKRNRNGWQSPGRWPQSRNASFLMRRPMVSIYLCERRSSTRLLTYSIDLALR